MLFRIKRLNSKVLGYQCTYMGILNLTSKNGHCQHVYGGLQAKFMGEKIPKILSALGLFKLLIDFLRNFLEIFFDQAEQVGFMFVVNIPWSSDNPLTKILPNFQFAWNLPGR